MSTSTGEQPHSGHGTATSSGLSIRVSSAFKGSDLSADVGHGTPRDWHTAVTARPAGSLPGKRHADRRTPAPPRPEHLGCQGRNAQTLAGMGIVEYERRWMGGVESGEDRTTADTCREER
jgi:hypothetical protein